MRPALPKCSALDRSLGAGYAHTAAHRIPWNQQPLRGVTRPVHWPTGSRAGMGGGTMLHVIGEYPSTQLYELRRAGSFCMRCAACRARYTFRHALTHEVAYGVLLQGATAYAAWARRAGHRELFAERLPGLLRAGPSLWSQRQHHQAVDYLQRAGQRRWSARPMPRSQPP